MNAQVEKYFTPVQELNTLTVDNVEKLVNLQIKRIQEHATFSIEQMKAASSVKDADSLKAYMADYADSMRQLSERTVEDVRAVFELGNAFTTEAQRIMQDAFKTK